MQYHTLGKTGIHVSADCLGARLFGAASNPDHLYLPGIIS